MKNVRKIRKSLKNNHFHPLNFFVPNDIRQVKPYEVMPDGVISFFTFTSEAQDDKEFLLKISTSEKRQYNENLTYMMDNTPSWILQKFNSFSFKEKDGQEYYYSIFKMIDCTLDDFIDNRLEFSTLDEIWMNKNIVNPSFIKQPRSGSKNVKFSSPEPAMAIREDDFIKESEMLYLWKQVIYALSDLQKARIWHLDIRPSNIAMVSPEEKDDGFDNRKTDYTTNPFKEKSGKQGNTLRDSNPSSYNINRNTAWNSNGTMTDRFKSGSKVHHKEIYNYEGYSKPTLGHKSLSFPDQTPTHSMSNDTYRQRSTGGTNSACINKLSLKLINFDSSIIIDHNASDKIEIKNYPCNNDIYASQYVLDYIDAHIPSSKIEDDTNSLKVKRMAVFGSRKSKFHKKKINPFKEDVYATGMTLLQLSALYREEEMMGMRDLISNHQYLEAFQDIKYSFLLKLYLRFLLTNDSDERPDFIIAKKVFDQMFMGPHQVSMGINDDLENSMDINKCTNDMILDAINVHYSETKQKSLQRFSSWNDDYDTPKLTDFMTDNSAQTSRRLLNSRSQGNLEDYYAETIMPLRLDEKFSDCLDNSNNKRKSKVTKFLETFSEANSRILPASKICLRKPSNVNRTNGECWKFHDCMNQRNPFSNKVIMWKAHNKPATQAWLLLHYGEYFCNSWEHKCGEVEDLEQRNKLKNRAVDDAANSVSELINKVQTLNRRRNDTEDIDLIFYSMFDSLKCLHDEIKAKNVPKSDYLKLISNFVWKVEKSWYELKIIRNQVEEMFKRKDYYGIYKCKTDYHLKLTEISETKEDIKQYRKLIKAERETISSGQEEIADKVINLVQDYFYDRSKNI